MCTLAWRQQQDRLWICFNRDEQRSRPVAESPLLHIVEGNPCVFARDPEGGGTWFAASSHGFAIALLNNYTANEAGDRPGTLSRGQLVLQLCRADSLDQAATCIDRISPEVYSPFYLFLLSRTQVYAWSSNGLKLERLDPDRPYWTSSSFKPAEVEEYRRQFLERASEKSKDMAELAASLRKLDEQMPTHGVTMDREATRTVSQIELRLDASGIRFLYYAREPDGRAFLPFVEVTWPEPEK